MSSNTFSHDLLQKMTLTVYTIFWAYDEMVLLFSSLAPPQQFYLLLPLMKTFFFAMVFLSYSNSSLHPFPNPLLSLHQMNQGHLKSWGILS